MTTILRVLLVGFVASSVLFADWIEVQKQIEASGNTSYGSSISIDGRFAAIGAPEENSLSGAVYILKAEDNGSWSPFQKIDNIPNLELSSTDYYEFQSVGWDVDIVDNNSEVTLIIGAPESVHWTGTYDVIGGGWNYDAGPASAFLMYDLNSTTNQFVQTKEFYRSGSDSIGYSVAVGYRNEIIGYVQQEVLGQIIPVPVYGFVTMAVSGSPDLNEVHIYTNEHGTNDWNQSIISGAAAGDQFGYSVAIDKDSSHLIIGAPYNDVSHTNSFTGTTTVYDDKGRAYIYKAGGTNADGYTWDSPQVLTQYIPDLLNNQRVNSGCHFGIAVNINMDKAIVGAESENISDKNWLDGTYPINDGEAVAYSLDNTDGNAWSFDYTAKSSSVNSPDDGFGLKVTISGNLSFIGAPTLNDGTTTTGGTFIYDFNGTSLSEVAALIPEVPGSFGSDVAYQGGQLFIGNSDNDEMSIYEDITITAPTVNPALIIYLLN